MIKTKVPYPFLTVRGGGISGYRYMFGQLDAGYLRFDLTHGEGDKGSLGETNPGG